MAPCGRCFDLGFRVQNTPTVFELNRNSLTRPGAPCLVRPSCLSSFQRAVQQVKSESYLPLEIERLPATGLL